MGFTAIKFPEMRRELLSYLSNLSDINYQKKCWVLKECPSHIEYDELDNAVHFFFDDTQLSSCPEKLIGYLLYNIAEARAVSSVCKSIETVFDAHGYGKMDEEYISSEEWKNVIEKARQALQLLLKIPN